MTQKSVNEWMVKTADGLVLGPYSTAEVLGKIRRGELGGEEQISPFPGHNWQKIARNPEFYDTLLQVLSGKMSEVRAHTAIAPDAEMTNFPEYKGEELDVESEPEPVSTSSSATSKGAEPEWRRQRDPQSQTIINPTKTRGKKEGTHKRAPRDIEMVDTTRARRKAVGRRAWLPLVLAAVALLGGLYLILGPESEERDARIRLLSPRPSSAALDTKQAKEKFNRGMAYFFSDTFSGYVRAQNDLVAVAESDTRNGSVLAMLCMTYLELWPFAYQDTEDLKALSRTLQLAGALEPSGIHVATCKTVDLMIKGRWIEAGNLADSSLESFGRSETSPTQFYFLKASLLKGAGDFQSAIDYAAFALKIWPQWIRPRILQAEAYSRAEKPEGAVKIYREILSTNPEHQVAMIELGLLELHAFRNLERAQAHLVAGVAEPDQVARRVLSRGFFGLAEIALARKSNEESLKFAELAYQADSTNTQAKNLVVQLGGAGELTQTKFKSYQLIAEGDQYAREGDCNAAQAHYKAAFEIDKKNAIAAMKAAECLWKLSLTTEAIDWLNRSIRSDPKLLEAYVRLADYYSERYNFQAAAQTLQAAQREAPKSYEVLRGFAMIEFRRGNAKSAAEFLKRALELYDADVESQILMAEANLKLGLTDEAFRHAAKAVELDVNHRKAQVTYGRALAALRGVVEGLAYLEALVNRYPVVGEYRLAYGKALLEDERYSDAEAVFRHLAQIDVKSKDALLELGKTLRAQGRSSEALEVFLKAAVLDPADAEPIFLSGLLYLDVAKAGDARVQFERVKAINKLYPLVHYQLGRSWLLEGTADKALAEAKLERRQNPDLADAYILGAEAYTAMKQYSLCIGEYQNAIKLRPQSALIYIKLAQCYRKSDQLDIALSMLSKAAEKESGLPDIYREQGVIYELQDDPQRAVEAYSQYFVLNPNAPDRPQIEERIQMLQRRSQ